MGAGLCNLRRVESDPDDPRTGTRTYREPCGRWRCQSVSGKCRHARRRPRWHREEIGPRDSQQRKSLRNVRTGFAPPQNYVPAHHPTGGAGLLRRRRSGPAGLRKGVRGVLCCCEARRVAPVPPEHQPMGAGSVLADVLSLAVIRQNSSRQKIESHKKETRVTRRELLPVVGLSGSLFTAAAQPNPPPGAAAGSPKIGSVSWNFHSLAPGAHPEESIDII